MEHCKTTYVGVLVAGDIVRMADGEYRTVDRIESAGLDLLGGFPLVRVHFENVRGDEPPEVVDPYAVIKCWRHEDRSA